MKNRVSKKTLENFKSIEEEFFEIHKERRLAVIRLSFDRVSDVFDLNYITRKPIMSDDFMEWITDAFSIIPSRYKIKLVISFKDYEGYSKEQLDDIFRKNIILFAKSKRDGQRKRHSIAYGLIAVGMVFFVGMLLTEITWETESIVKTIVSYISDIATTVAFWEAMNILIVEKREQRSYLMAVEKRFAGVTFEDQ